MPHPQYTRSALIDEGHALLKSIPGWSAIQSYQRLLLLHRMRLVCESTFDCLLAAHQPRFPLETSSTQSESEHEATS